MKIIKFFCIVCIVSISMLVFFNSNVKALTIKYYVSDYGVELTKEEYDFFTEMYFEGYQKYLTEEDMKHFTSKELKKEFVEKSVYTEPYIKSRGTFVETSLKRIQISKSGTTNPVVSLVLTWFSSPNVKSYDVMGAYLLNTNLTSNVTTKITYTGGAIYANNIKKTDDGFGISLKIPNGANDVQIVQTYNVTKNGSVYGSYQHSLQNVTANESKSYQINRAGYGGVFLFDYGINSKYDAMQGVKIDV